MFRLSVQLMCAIRHFFAGRGFFIFWMGFAPEKGANAQMELHRWDRQGDGGGGKCHFPGWRATWKIESEARKKEETKMENPGWVEETIGK